MNLNKACLLGRITRDPYFRSEDGKTAFASISIATNDFWVGKDGIKREKAQFHDVVFWGRLAEVIRNQCHKGTLLYVEGRLQTREDKEGQFRTEIVGNFLQIEHQRVDVDDIDIRL